MYGRCKNLLHIIVAIIGISLAQTTACLNRAEIAQLEAQTKQLITADAIKNAARIETNIKQLESAQQIRLAQDLKVSYAKAKESYLTAHVGTLADRVEKALSQFDAERINLLVQLNEQKTKIAHLEADTPGKAQLEKERNALQAQLQNSTQVINQLKKQLSELQVTGALSEEMKKQYEFATKTIGDLKNKIDQLEATINTLESEKKILLSEKAELESLHKQANDQRLAAEKSNAELRVTIEELKNIAPGDVTLQNKVSKLEAELKELDEAHDKLKNFYKELENRAYFNNDMADNIVAMLEGKAYDEAKSKGPDAVSQFLDNITRKLQYAVGATNAMPQYKNLVAVNPATAFEKNRVKTDILDQYKRVLNDGVGYVQLWKEREQAKIQP